MTKRSTGWRTIDSAPRDGTAFLAWLPAWQGYFTRADVEILHWTEWGGGSWELRSGFKVELTEPTHWMELPGIPFDAEDS